jgi:predicted nucleic acid-binding protein
MIKIDASSLIYSLKMDFINVLNKLFNQLIITNAVFEEVIIYGKEKRKPDAFIGEKLIKETIIKIHEIKKELLKLGLGMGETEVIQNSIDLDCPCLIDDKKAKRIAESFGLNVRTIPISILEAYKKDIIDEESFEDYLNKWIKYANPSYNEIYFIKKIKELIK